MKGIASACGSATVINAIASGNGAAFGIDLRVESSVELVEGSSGINGKVGETGEDSELIEICVDKVLEREGLREDFGARVETTTGLPIAVGLSSSSAAANSTVLATFDALDREVEPNEAVNIGIEAAFEAGTTVTGAYDDASASYLGGGVITDNKEREILGRFDIDPDLTVLIYIPPERSYTADIDVDKTKQLSEIVDSVHKKALNGKIYGAQTVNGLLYSSVLGFDFQPALDALEAGAKSAGLTGTGPATVAICEKEKVESVKKKWKKRANRVIETRPSEEGARIENE